MTTRASKPADTTGAQDDMKQDGDSGTLQIQNGPSTEPPVKTAGGPLDHDGNGRPGGSAPPPQITYLVVLKGDAERGLAHGEVIGVADKDVKPLLHDDTTRSATDDEVDLAQPRVRLWTPPAA